MYTCKDLNQLLLDYLEGWLPEDVRKEVDYHLSLCPNCIKYINTYKKTIELTGRLSLKEMPPELEKTLLRVLTKKSD